MESEPSLPEIITRPLADDPGMRGYVTGQLEELQHRAKIKTGDQTAEQIARAFATGEANSSRSKKRGVVIKTAAILLVILAVVFELWQALPYFVGTGRYPALQRLAGQRLHGIVGEDAYFDPSAKGENEVIDTTRRAWEKHPDSPEYYYIYSNILVRHGRNLPSDFSETTARLDPGNGLWDLLRAQDLAFKAIEKRSKSKVPDPELQAASIEAMRAAERKPKLDGYGARLREIYGRSYSPRSTAEREQLVFYFGDSNELLAHPQPFDLRLLILPEFRRIEADPAASADFLKLVRKILIRSILAGEPPHYELANMERWISTHGTPAEIKQFRHLQNLGDEIEFEEPPSDSLWNPSSVVYFTRLILTPASATLLFLAGLGGLREFPRKGVISRTASCLDLMLRARTREVAVWSLTLLLAAGFLGALVSMRYAPEPVAALQLGPLLALASSILILVLTRGHLSSALGFLGIQSSPMQMAMGYLALGGAIASIGGSFTGANELLTSAVGVILLYLIVRIILGYTSFGTSLRHCLFARNLATTLSRMAGTLAACALLLHPVESLLVKQDWHAYHAKLAARAETFRAAHQAELQQMLDELADSREGR